MKTLIVAATATELNGLYGYFDLTAAPLVSTENFDILVTGVGMTATAFALGRYLHKNYDLVLNLGIAGCFDHTVSLGTVFNVVSDKIAELGAEDHENFIDIEELGFGKSRFLSSYSKNHPSVTALPEASGITVNRVHGNAESISSVIRRLRPDTESMEGAAVFYACAEAGLPCLQVRAVSNYVEPRNRASWQIGLAIENLNTWAIQFLTNQ